MESIVIVDMPSRLNRFGGEARIAASLFRGLRKRFDTYYLGFGTSYISEREKGVILPSASSAIGKPIRNKSISESALAKLAYNALVVRNLYGIDKPSVAKKMKEISPSVIISNSVQDMPLLLYLKRSGINSKMIYIDHGSISSEFVRGYFSKAAMPLTIGSGIQALSVTEAKRKFFRFFDAVVALNMEQYRAIRNFTEDVVYIPNGISVSLGRNEKIEKSIRERYSIGDKRVVLYVGRMFERQKNVSTLIRAFSISRIDASLLLVGDGPSLNDYMRMSEGDSRIAFAGGVDEHLLKYFYNIASVFVLPSFWEGFNLTILEAAAHRLPMLISEAACIEDLKVYKIPTFKTRSAEDLRSKLESLMASKSMMTRARRSSAMIASHFTEERMLSEYSKLIGKLLEK
ncbi:MAG: glycosyltransferase family 4 protein [Candidatus Micrarchaeia archaeon]